MLLLILFFLKGNRRGSTVDTLTIRISKAFHMVVLHLLFPYYGERDVRVDMVGCFYLKGTCISIRLILTIKLPLF